MPCDGCKRPGGRLRKVGDRWLCRKCLDPLEIIELEDEAHLRKIGALPFKGVSGPLIKVK